MTFRLSLLPAAVLTTVAFAATAAARPRLDAFRPIDVRSPDGPREAASAEDWKSRRAEILEAFVAVAGPMPPPAPVPPAWRIDRETDCGDRVRRLIRYESCPGSFTPAWLTIPKAALAGSPAPAVLCLHPTDMEAGHDVAVGLRGKPGRAYADELAARGFVTIAPSYPLMAGYQPDLKADGFESGTARAIHDNRRALDLLASLPSVMPGPRGAIGHSLGGHNALFTALFDARIGAVVTSCGFDSFRDYYDGDPANWQPERGWCQTRYMPRLAAWRDNLADIPFDFPEILAALAPRPVFVSAPLHDSNFRAASVDRIAAAVRPVYALHGAADAVTVRHPDCGHDFPEAVRLEAYAALADAIGKPQPPPAGDNDGKSTRRD